jgi:exonuclease SbcC
VVREAQQRTSAALAARRQRREEAASERERLLAAVAGLAEVEREIAAEEPRLREAQGLREALLPEHGSLQSKYQRCLAVEQELGETRKQWEQARRDADLYAKLTTAFGKDGIQALIIENSIPEIEEEANHILRRLTHNRTQIAIEPLRDLKSGGTKETLDIHISDELGTRSHDLYSGGEQFRVNFALRLALSKLLAQRAGTKLRTLIIDEGFGTQDAEGLEQFVEAIREISVDFDKILVVTHLDSLKNAFPTRIEVFKEPERGSRFEIIG